MNRCRIRTPSARQYGLACALALLTVLSGCSGQQATTAPTAPTTATAPAAPAASPNRPPFITQLIRYREGLANTPLTLSAAATDPDGDPLTYVWSWTENTPSGPQYMTASGPSFTHVFQASVSQTLDVTLVVFDTHEGSVWDQVHVSLASLTGHWQLQRVFVASSCWSLSGVEMTLQQAGDQVTGTLSFSPAACGLNDGGRLMIVPTTIDADGNFLLRAKGFSSGGDLNLKGVLVGLYFATATATYDAQFTGFDSVELRRDIPASP